MHRDNKYLTKIVAASLLADGSVDIPPDGSKNARYRQPKVSTHLDYLEMLATKLDTITRTKIHPDLNNQSYLVTRCHPFYTNFRERMYPNGHKVVDPHYLTLLDWEFLAIWYQEDGSTVMDKREQGTYVKIVLCTDCFSYAENHYLRIALKEKLNLEWNVVSFKNRGNHYYRLHLNKSQINAFMAGITSFIVPSFEYKLCSTVGNSTRLES